MFEIPSMEIEMFLHEGSHIEVVMTVTFSYLVLKLLEFLSRFDKVFRLQLLSQILIICALLHHYRSHLPNIFQILQQHRRIIVLSAFRCIL